MRKIILSLLISIISFSATANTQRRIAYFTKQSEYFKQLCFDGDGTFFKDLVFYDPNSSIDETAMNCNAQAIALNQEAEAIEREMQALGGENCQLDIADPSLVDLLNGGTGIIDELNCPGIGSASQCAATVACNLLTSMIPMGSSLAQYALKDHPTLGQCGSSGANCFTSIGAAIADNLWDTVTGLCWLVTFGNACAGDEEAPSPEDATSVRGIAATEQDDAQVASFTSDPIGYMYSMGQGLLNMLSETIASRYGCQQWTGVPHYSECAVPMEWDCANCDQKTNMICGVAGYVGAEIVVSFFTGGAAGAVKVSSKLKNVKQIAQVAEYLSTSRVGRGVRLLGRGGAIAARKLGEVWNGIVRSRSVTAIRSVAGSVGGSIARANNFLVKNVRVYGASQELMIRAARGYNELATAAFNAGYELTGGVRSATAARLISSQNLVSLKDIESGLYRSQGIASKEDYFRVATRNMTPAERSRVRLTVTTDDPPRVVISSTEAVQVDSNIRVDFNPEAPRPSSPAPRSPARVADEVAEVAEENVIVVTANRRSSGLTVTEASRVDDLPVSTGGSTVSRPGSGGSSGLTVESNGSRTVSQVTSRDPEDVIQRFAGANHTLEDREIVIDIISGSPRKSEYLKGKNLDDPYYIRYEELERRLRADPNLSRYADDLETYAASRVASGNERAARELDDLKGRHKIDDVDIDCGAMNRVYPKSFPESGGKCKSVEFKEDIRGEYCACGNMSKTTFNWLVRCPKSGADFKSIMGFADDLALPSGSLPEMCSRVDIPKGKKCYMGSTSVTFAGFGGAVQLLCMDGGTGRMSEDAKAAVREFGLQTGTPRISGQRWSPFSDFSEYQSIVERASRSCPDICSPEEFALIERQFADATNAIRNRTSDPIALQRLEREQSAFRDYLSDLKNGRLPTPALSRAARYTPDERIAQTKKILRLDEVNPRQREAILRAHEVGASEGRGYFTFSQPDIAEKARILREAGFNRDQIRRLMTNGIVGGRPENALSDAVSTASRADQMSRDLSYAVKNNRDFELTELQNVRRSSGQSYEVAAMTDDNPILIKASSEQYLQAGDADSAKRVLAFGERNGQSRQAQVRDMSLELTRAENRLRNDPLNPALKAEVDARRRLIRELRPPQNRTVSPSQNRPPQTPVRQPSSTPEPPARKAPSEMSVGDARNAANRLRMDGNYEEASLYYARAAQRPTLDDRDFVSAYENSLRGNGTFVERQMERLQSNPKVDDLNKFIWEIHEKELYKSPDPTFRANLNRILKTVDQNKLFSPQQNVIRSWIRNTEP